MQFVEAVMSTIHDLKSMIGSTGRVHFILNLNSTEFSPATASPGLMSYVLPIVINTLLQALDPQEPSSAIAAGSLGDALALSQQILNYDLLDLYVDEY